MPDHLIEVIARFTRLVRESPAVDGRSGVSARFAIAAAETAAAAAVRRTALIAEARTGRSRGSATCPASCRRCAARSSSRSARRAARTRCSVHLLRRAVAETFRARLGGADLSGLLARFEDGGTVETGELVPATELLRRGRRGRGPGRAAQRLGEEGAESPGVAAAALEFALEGLYLIRRISKDSSDGASTCRHRQGSLSNGRVVHGSGDG